MMSKGNDDHDPAWLDNENDQIHRKEVEPLLFGTGKLPLADPCEHDHSVNPFGDNDDLSDTSKSKSSGTSKQPKKQQTVKGYGSTDSNTSPKTANRSSLWTIATPATSQKKNDDEESLDKNKDDDFDSNFDPEDSKQGVGGDSDEENVMDEITFHERTGRPHPPTRHCCLRIFITVQTFGIATNLALLVSQVLPMVFVSWTTANKEYIALKIYLCAFALIFLVIEIDHPSIPFLRKASFLKTFASRGFLYTFFGLVCFGEADSEAAYKSLEGKTQDLGTIFEVSWFGLVNLIAAWSLMALGTLYFVMGIFCLQRVRNRYVYDNRQKWKLYREAMDKWKEGL